MNTKVLLAALAGAIATFLSGWLLYGIALRGFFESNTLEGARSLMRTEPTFWAIFVGCLAWAALLAMVFSRWASITTFVTGAKAGAWIAFLIALGADFFNYASMDAWTLTATLVDPFVNAVQGAIAGGVVGWVLGYGNRA